MGAGGTGWGGEPSAGALALHSVLDNDRQPPLPASNLLRHNALSSGHTSTIGQLIEKVWSLSSELPPPMLLVGRPPVSVRPAGMLILTTTTVRYDVDMYVLFFFPVNRPHG